MKAKFLLTYFFALSVIHGIKSQKIASFSISPIYEGNVLSTGGFDKLNEVLKRHNLYTIQNEFMSNGISLCFTKKNNLSGIEFSYLRVASYLYDSTVFTNRTSLPFLTGSNIRISYFRKLFETRRWYSNATLGISMINLNFKIVDGSKQIFSLDSLIANPNLSPTLDFTQNRGSICVDGSAAIYFKTKWLKKAFDDFDIGARFGYAQPLVNGSQWRVNGTRNVFLATDLPTIRLNNLYFQLSFLFKYNFLEVSPSKTIIKKH